MNKSIYSRAISIDFNNEVCPFPISEYFILLKICWIDPILHSAQTPIQFSCYKQTSSTSP